MEFNYIEVCAGAGGMSMGLNLAGFKPLLLNDNNKDCCNTLKFNHKHKDINIICDNMENLLNNKIIDKYINKLDLLVGGIPCQSFSQAGKRKGLDDNRGKLIYSFIELIKKLNPKMFMIENVKGLLTHNKGETLNNILKLLNIDNTYNVIYKVLNAFDFGVPQKRERIFIIGIHIDIKNIFEFPKKENKHKYLKDVLFDVPKSEYIKYNKEKIELFKMIPQGGCWINLPEELQKKYLGKSYTSGGGKRGILKRLSFDEPCLTLLCSPTQKQTERCHPTENRPLTIREYARIQTFPDDYVFCGSITSQYKQIGNAVPIELVKKIAINLINCLT